MKSQDIQILQFELTSYCNAMCVHCPRFSQLDRYESSGELHRDLSLTHTDIDNIINNLELSKLSNLKILIVEGDKGDPLMHPKIERFIDVFSTLENAPTILLTTNGSIRDATWWANLAKKNYSNLFVTFSIDGLKDTNHLYRVGLDFDTIIENASSFIANGGRAFWKMLVFKHNEHQIDTIQSLSQSMGFAMFKAQNSHIDRFKGKSNWLVRNKSVEWFIEPAVHQYNIEEKFVEFPKKLELVNYFDQLCPNLRRGHMYINHLNQIVPCCMMHFDTELNYFGKDQLLNLMGDFDNYDLSKHTLEYILSQDFYKHVLQDSLRTDNMHYTCKKSCSHIIKNYNE